MKNFFLILVLPRVLSLLTRICVNAKLDAKIRKSHLPLITKFKGKLNLILNFEFLIFYIQKLILLFRLNLTRHFVLYETIKFFPAIPFSAEVSLRCPSEELPATGSELAAELLLSVQERFRPLLESELAGSPM